MVPAHLHTNGKSYYSKLPNVTMEDVRAEVLRLICLHVLHHQDVQMAVDAITALADSERQRGMDQALEIMERLEKQK